MDINISLREERCLPVDAQTLIAALSDIRTTLEHFPKLKPVHEVSPDCFLWELETIGALGITHDVKYATFFTFEQNAIHFCSVPNAGNAIISGSFTAKQVGHNAELVFSVEGTLLDIKVPRLLHKAAPPVVKGIFDNLMGDFISNIESDYLALLQQAA